MVVAAGGPVEYLRCEAWVAGGAGHDVRLVLPSVLPAQRTKASCGALSCPCRGPWNAFDFLMVLAGYTTFIPAGTSSAASGAAAVRAVRALRALRPLRTITRFEALRSIVVCFLEVGARQRGQVAVLCLIIIGLLAFLLLPAAQNKLGAALPLPGCRLQAMPMLISVVGLLYFFMLLFAIAATGRAWHCQRCL